MDSDENVENFDKNTIKVAKIKMLLVILFQTIRLLFALLFLGDFFMFIIDIIALFVIILSIILIGKYNINTSKLTLLIAVFFIFCSSIYSFFNYTIDDMYNDNQSIGFSPELGAITIFCIIKNYKYLANVQNKKSTDWFYN